MNYSRGLVIKKNINKLLMVLSKSYRSRPVSLRPFYETVDGPTLQSFPKVKYHRNTFQVLQISSGKWMNWYGGTLRVDTFLRSVIFLLTNLLPSSSQEVKKSTKSEDTQLGSKVLRIIW